MKTCTKCKESKTLDLFYKRTTNIDGYYTWCKACELLERQSRRLKYPDTGRNQDLKKLYGISLEEYNRLYVVQKGCCAICKVDNNIRKIKGETKEESFCVDHCHETGRVRGLLCYKCNAGLGMFKDNTEFMQSAINYLDSEGD